MKTFIEEFLSTLEALLSQSVQYYELYKKNKIYRLDDTSIIIKALIENKENQDIISLIVPNDTANKMEYLLVGGMGELKYEIDNEVVDAVSAIISNIFSSYCTAYNAKGDEYFPLESRLISNDLLTKNSHISLSLNFFQLDLKINDDIFRFFLSFNEKPNINNIELSEVIQTNINIDINRLDKLLNLNTNANEYLNKNLEMKDIMIYLDMLDNNKSLLIKHKDIIEKYKHQILGLIEEIEIKLRESGIEKDDNEKDDNEKDDNEKDDNEKDDNEKDDNKLDLERMASLLNSFNIK